MRFSTFPLVRSSKSLGMIDLLIEEVAVTMAVGALLSCILAGGWV